MKFKLITEAYQTLRIRNTSLGRNSIYHDGPNVGYDHKKEPRYYVNMFYDIADYIQKIKHVKTVYSYLLKHKPILVMYCGLIRKHAYTQVGRLFTSSHTSVNSFISHIQREKLTQNLLKYLGIHT